MLMLTHTWIMKEYLEGRGCPPVAPELYAYNVIADLLPIHRDITAEMTHQIERFSSSPTRLDRDAFIRFHVVIDDFSHYGTISPRGPARFLDDSPGYTYVRGKPLVAAVMDLHGRAGKEIDLSLAGYQSHMLIEMAFDMLLCRTEGKDRLLEYLYRGLKFMLAGDRQETSLFLGSRFGIATDVVVEALELTSRICTYEGLQKTLDDKGRTHLCLDKFGLDTENQESQREMMAMLHFGMDLVADYRDFLKPALAAIAQSGF